MSAEIKGNHYVITDACRKMHGSDEAAVDDALARLREEVLHSLRGRPMGQDARFHVRFSVERPPPIPDQSNRTTTDGQPPRPGHEGQGAPAPINPDTGQHEAYWVLSPEERAKGFVRPLRRSYKHVTCGTVTTMGLAIAQTYATQPTFYGSTFCAGCKTHYPVGPDGEFVWEGTSEKVGT